MNVKYMRKRTIVLPTLTVIIIASLLQGCAASSQEDTLTAMHDTESITLEVAEPSNSQTQTKVDQQSTLDWTQLASLTTYADLRSALESALSITTTGDIKEGILYKNPDTLETDQNTTLLLNLRNQDYALKFVQGDTDAFTSASESSFSDTDEDSQLAATINAYYNLLPDETEGVFNGDATLTRAEAMALVMRATTPVTESGEPESDEAFTSAVGYTSFTDYASAVDSLAYLNTSNGLDTESFDGAMTEGEFTYLVIKSITSDYKNYLDTVKDELPFVDYDGYVSDIFDTSSVTLSTIKDAGSISLSDAIANPDNGVPTDMYETFKLGIKLGMITESDLEDWDTAITKTDAITNFTNETANFMVGGYADNDYAIVSGTTSTTTSQKIHNEAVASGEFTDVYEDTRPADEVTYETTAGYDLWQNTEFGNYGETSKDQAWQNWNNYAKESGADYAVDYYWVYTNGSAAGSSGSYLVYMKEGSEHYGEVFQYGDTLLDGSINKNGTNQEYYDWVTEGAIQAAEDEGILETDDNGNYVINLDLLDD
jgi:hypothetical protein